METKPEGLTLVEAARLIGYHPESLRRLVRYGDIKATKVGNILLFRQEDLEAAFDLGERSRT
jgi:excisionase family DNA binding protein